MTYVTIPIPTHLALAKKVILLPDPVKYEISLYWILDSAPNVGSGGEASGPTFIQAVQKELGLRVEKTTNGMKDVLVVDHVDKKPTVN